MLLECHWMSRLFCRSDIQEKKVLTFDILKIERISFSEAIILIKTSCTFRTFNCLFRSEIHHDHHSRTYFRYDPIQTYSKDYSDMKHLTILRKPWLEVPCQIYVLCRSEIRDNCHRRTMF